MAVDEWEMAQVVGENGAGVDDGRIVE